MLNKLLLSYLLCFAVSAQTSFPGKAKRVTDLAGSLSKQQETEVEAFCVAFEKQTGGQIVVVFV